MFGQVPRHNPQIGLGFNKMKYAGNNIHCGHKVKMPGIHHGLKIKLIV